MGSLHLAASLSAATLVACTDLDATPPSSTGGGGGDPGPAPCATGHVETPDGCTPVGLKGCAEVFVDDDGVCRPRLAKCPPDNVPSFAVACSPAGIQACSDVFVEEGRCRPSAAKCPAGTLALPKEGCVPLDGQDGCGEGTFGAVVEAEGDVHVDPTYASGGSDGSRTKPFTTVAAAMAAVESGKRVVLAAGDYDEPVEIARPVALVGRCASLVTLRGTLTEPTGNVVALWIHGATGVSVSGVRVSGAPLGVLVDAAEATLRAVHVQGANVAGVAVTKPGASLAMSHSFIESTRTDPSLEDSWTGVLVFGGAHATLTANLLLDAGTGVRVSSQGQQVTVDGNLIETRQQDTETEETGLAVDTGTVHLSDNAVVGSKTGVAATSADATVVATHNLITAPPDGPPDSAGVAIRDGALATLDANVLAGGGDAQLVVDGAATRVTASGNLFQGAEAAPAQSLGRAVEVRSGALTFTSNAVVQAHNAGLAALGGALQASGNLIERTAASPMAPLQTAAIAIDGADVVLQSTYVAQSSTFGVLHASGGSLELTDSLIEETTPGEQDGNDGVALLSTGATKTVVRGSALVGSSVAGILLVGSPATVELTLVERVAEGAFYAWGASGQPTITRGIGDGLLSLSSGITVSSTQAKGCARAGLLFDGSTGTVARSGSTENRFGLVLQGPEAPTIAEDNLFEGNSEEDVSEGTLEVPAPPASGP